MAILSTIKRKATTGLVKAADKGANLVAKASSLSSAQLQNIEERRNRFMSEKPETDPEGIKRLLGSYAIEAFEAYLPQISELYEPIAMEMGDDKRSLINRIRYFQITKWVTDPSEDNIEKLVNVYQVISREACNMALIYNRKENECNVYLAIVSNDSEDKPTIANALEERIEAAFRGNFPGSEIKGRNKETTEKNEFGLGVLSCLKDLEGQAVAAVSNIATEKSDDFINQSMEKLLDGICPKEESDEYTIVLLASPVGEQLERKNALSELYSKLSPYASWQTSFSVTENVQEGSSATLGVSAGGSFGKRSAKEEIEQHSVSEEQRIAEIEREAEEKLTRTVKRIEGEILASISKETKLPFKIKAKLEASVKAAASKETIKSKVSQTAVETSSAAINSVSKLYQTGKRGIDFGVNFGADFSRSSNVSVNIGKNEGLTQTFVNHSIKYTLDTIEKQIKRLEESSALGMWDFSAYFISKNPVIANNAAHMYLALTQGDESYLAQSAVNLWVPPANANKNIENDKRGSDVKNILEYVKRLQHPQFQLIDVEDDEWLMYPPHVSTTVSLTGRELARSLNFPKKSISGMPVIDCASFGREVHKYIRNQNDDEDIPVGCLYHMHHRDEKILVKLNPKSLTAHTFITGSTGTGKSNTVYQLLHAVKEHDKGIKFMVIEPAKGEYKEWLGKGINVFGTNSDETELLYINPFSFPKGIHVLEHIDRFVEILNSCWPMYAAMPAILKDSIERVYLNRGWNLQKNKCSIEGNDRFPTFADLLVTLPEVMEESSYSSDTKNDYSGALITRVKSLTNGLNGQLLCGGIETDSEALFDQDTIIDLSRIGSMETRSFFMGILIMKLQEYRMDQKGEANEELKHLTVIEEAHNLLRRTSISQAQESSNLQGKSVEMLTNSIAEMRTYGEGFVIVDQAPGLLDEAVIRNTNTKIIMRLPDAEDRITAGKSAALNEVQIDEIAKLPRGVAVVYQNDWVEAVLCSFDEYKDKQSYDKPKSQRLLPMDMFMTNVFGVGGFSKLSQEDVDSVLAWIENSKYARETKRIMTKAVKDVELTEREKQLIAYNVFEGKMVAKMLAGAITEQDGIAKADNYIRINSEIQDEFIIETIRQMILQVIVNQNKESDLAKRYVEYSGRVL